MQPDLVVIGVVVRRELGANLKTALRWLAPLAGLVLLVCALQPSLAAGPLAAKIESMPAMLRSALGLGMVDFQRPAFYLATNFTSVVLGAALFAALLGAGTIAKEEALHTAELLYSAPVRRSRILIGKAIAVLIYTVALPIALAVVAIATLAAVVERPLEPALLASLFGTVVVIAICFAGAGMWIATRVRDARGAGGVALGLVLGAFALGIVSSLAPPVSALRYFSPFKLLEAPAIVAGGVPVVSLVAVAATGFGLAARAVQRYERRDLHT